MRGATLIPALVLASALGLMAKPAEACIKGPLPLTFIGKTAALDEDGKFLLRNYGRDRPADTLLVIFYKSGVPASLAQEREHRVRAYLKAIARGNVSVVQSRKPLPKSLAQLFGSQSTATVEAVHGCF